MAEEPYRNLYASILTQAIEDLQIKRILKAQERPWKGILENDPEFYLFRDKRYHETSFPMVCEILNLDPETMRLKIKEHFKNGLSTLSR